MENQENYTVEKAQNRKRRNRQGRYIPVDIEKGKRNEEHQKDFIIINT